MNPNQHTEPHSPPSHQFQSASGDDHELPSVAVTPDSTSETAPFTEATRLWWMKLLSHWKRYRIVLLIFPVVTFAPDIVQLLPNAAGSFQTSNQQLVSRADYERLELGMTLTDVQATLGRAIEVSQDETSATYKWVNSDGSQIMAVFRGDRLVSKEQIDLK
jgi:hypothetical protein